MIISTLYFYWKGAVVCYILIHSWTSADAGVDAEYGFVYWETQYENDSRY